jgi:hypothetical protein
LLAPFSLLPVLLVPWFNGGGKTSSCTPLSDSGVECLLSAV